MAIINLSHRGDTSFDKLLGHLPSVQEKWNALEDILKNEGQLSVDLKEEIRVILDKSITRYKNLVIGANKTDHHYINANYKRDFDGEVAEDLLTAKEGDLSLDGKEKLQIARGIEVGNIFQLGTKYSESLEAYFLDENGKQKPFIMGSYGIGITRSISAIIEQHYDDNGIIWPTKVAPFEAWITLVNKNNEEQKEIAEKIYNKL